MSADDTHIITAKIDVKVQIRFAVLGGNVTKKRSNLHRTFECMLSVLPEVHMIQPNHNVIRRPKRLDCTKSNMFCLVELCERRDDLMNWCWN